MEIITKPDYAYINPDKLVGTKWTTWNNVYGDSINVEFIDRAKCVYTLQPNKYSLTYTVQEGVMYISNIEGSFVLRGDVLFNNDIPTFEKAA